MMTCKMQMLTYIASFPHKRSDYLTTSEVLRAHKFFKRDIKYLWWGHTYLPMHYDFKKSFRASILPDFRLSTFLLPHKCVNNNNPSYSVVGFFIKAALVQFKQHFHSKPRWLELHGHPSNHYLSVCLSKVGVNEWASLEWESHFL